VETGVFGQVSFWPFAPPSYIEMQNRFAWKHPVDSTGSTGRDLTAERHPVRTALTRFIPPERIGKGQPAPM
jgi:hypothetical protein